MSLTTPIIGQQYVIVNQTTQLSNETVGGTWSSSDTSIATIDSTLGIVLGILSGIIVITYTAGSDIATFSLSVQPANITNGLNTQLILDLSSNRINWKSQGDSDSGRFWEDFHSLNDETIIENLFSTINPTDLQYSSILSSLKRSVILDALNSIFNKPQLVDQPKLIFNRYGYDRLYLQPIINYSQFVGISFNIADGDFAVSFKKLILFFTKNCTFNLYLYNDMVDLPISKFPVTVKANSQTVIQVSGIMNLVLNYIATNSDAIGGRWFLGYYQDDIEEFNCQALFFNITYARFKIINPLAFSAVVIQDINDQSIRNFNRINIGANNLMYGMNAEICSYIDVTNSVIQNLQSGLFDNLFGLLMVNKIIEKIVFSYRNNKIQVNIMGNDMLDKLYTELNAVESVNPNELNFSNGVRKRIEDAKRVVKQGFQKSNKVFSGCG